MGQRESGSAAFYAMLLCACSNLALRCFLFFPNDEKCSRVVCFVFGLMIMVVCCYWCGCSYTSMNEGIVHPSIQPANQAPFHRRLEQNSLLSYYIFSHTIFHHRPKKVSHSRFSYQLTLTVLWWFTSLSVVVSSKKQKNTARSQVKSKIIGFFFCFLGDVWLFGGFVIYLFLISLFCWYIIHLKA